MKKHTESNKTHKTPIYEAQKAINPSRLGVNLLFSWINVRIVKKKVRTFELSKQQNKLSKKIELEFCQTRDYKFSKEISLVPLFFQKKNS